MPDDIEVIESLDELDEKLVELDHLSRVSDDALRQGFKSFRMNYPPLADTDPHSDAYRRQQFELYERISGRSYDLGNEATSLDVAAASTKPFPYDSESPFTVGHHLIAIGLLISLLPPRRASRVLEFGAGWGNTTLAMASMGYKVTAVDIEARFCELIRRRATMLGVEVDVVNGDFGLIEQVREPYDAVLFFESFHHCADHLRLLRSLAKATTSSAKILFASEPIVPDFPLPWGVRLDGESLWATRQFGWLELGFNVDYFKNTMIELGWQLEHHHLEGTPWASVWAASREPLGFLMQATDSTAHSQVGKLEDNAFRADGRPGFLLYGPYSTLPPGRYVATIRFVCDDTTRGTGVVDVVSSAGTVSHHKLEIDFGRLARGPSDVGFEFSLSERVSDVEVRVFVRAGAKTAISQAEVTAVTAVPKKS
jgi:2-polyprenyl-3-methyl-5-hydroxy-6-metoxy-1,4-benzoquinol methylase